MGHIQLNSRHRKIAALVYDHVRIGLYLPGSRLPSIATLAKDLQTTYGVVRSALELLAAEGKLIARAADGYYVPVEPGTGTSEYSRLYSTMLAAVFASKLSTVKLAELSGINRWTLSRAIHGRITLTKELAGRIIAAAQTDA